MTKDEQAIATINSITGKLVVLARQMEEALIAHPDSSAPPMLLSSKPIKPAKVKHLVSTGRTYANRHYDAHVLVYDLVEKLQIDRKKPYAARTWVLSNATWKILKKQVKSSLSKLRLGTKIRPSIIANIERCRDHLLFHLNDSQSAQQSGYTWEINQSSDWSYAIRYAGTEFETIPEAQFASIQKNIEYAIWQMPHPFTEKEWKKKASGALYSARQYMAGDLRDFRWIVESDEEDLQARLEDAKNYPPDAAGKAIIEEISARVHLQKRAVANFNSAINFLVKQRERVLTSQPAEV